MTDTNAGSESLKVVAVKGVATLTIQNILLQFIWFLTSLFLLNSISVSDFSVLKLVLAVVAVPSALYIAGIDPIILADLGVERELGRFGALKGLFRSYVLFELISAVVIWSGFFLAITFFRDLFSPPTRDYLFVASFMIFSRPLQNVVIQFFNLYFRFKYVTFMKLYDEGVTLIATIVFVWYFKQGIYAAILIQSVAPFIAILLSMPAFLALYRKQLQGVQRENAGFIARLKAHGKWSIAASYLATGSDTLHLFFIDRFVGRPAVALYALADSLWGHLISLFPIKSVLGIMVPQRSKDETMARQNLIRGTKYAFLGFVSLGAVSAIAGYPFLSIFFPKYVASFPIFLGLLLMIPRFSFSSALSPLLRAYKFQRASFTSAVVTLSLTVGFAILLYPMLGIAGVVAEVVLTNTLQAYLVYRAFLKQYPAFRIRLGELFVWDAYDREMVGVLVASFRRRIGRVAS